MAVTAVTSLNLPLTGGAAPPSGWFTNGGATSFVTGGVEFQPGGGVTDWDSNTETWTYAVGDYFQLRIWTGTPGSYPGYFEVGIGYTLLMKGTGGVLQSTGGSDVTFGSSFPEYYRFLRDTSTTFKLYTSVDGTTWTQRGSATYNPTSANIRLRVSAGTMRMGQLVGGSLPPPLTTVPTTPATETDAARPVTATKHASIRTFSESFPGGALGDWFYDGNTPVYYTGGIQVGGSGSLSTNASYIFEPGCSVTLKMRADTDGNMASRFRFMIRETATGTVFADIGARDGEIRALVGEPAAPYPTFTIGQFEWYRIARLSATTWASYTSVDGSTWTLRGTSTQTATPGPVNVAFSWQFGSVRIGPPIAGAGPLTTVPTTPATETDSAQQVAAAKAAISGSATETDTAQHIEGVKVASVASVTETDTAEPVAAALAAPVDAATETDTAQPVATATVADVTPGTETDTAESVTLARITAADPASEIDTAQHVAATEAVLVTPAVETDIAAPVATATSVATGPATETDTAELVTAITQTSSTVWTPVGNIQGPAGPTGGAGVVHLQTAPAATWSIPHGLGRIPHTVVIYIGGEQVFTDTQVDATNVVLSFPSSVVGEAHII